MRRVTVGLILAVVFVFGAAVMVHSATPEDAKALAEKAAAFWKANGKEKAIAEINNPKGQFVKGDIYVVAHDFNGNVLAHGANQGLVGKSLLEQKDPASGKFFVKEQIEIAKTKGSGWAEFSWANPQTKKIQPKKAWIVKIEGEDYLVNCGAWK